MVGSTHTHILAVDPGLTGAMAWMSCEFGVVRLLGMADMPTYHKKVGTSTKDHLDLDRLAQTIQNPIYSPTLAVIEQVGAAPGQGVTSMFRFGYAAGAVAGACAASGIDTHFVRPQHWQRWARKPQARAGQEAKAVSREHVLALFPDAARLFKRGKDHNRADAVLIGYAFFCEANRAALPT